MAAAEIGPNLTGILNRILTLNHDELKEKLEAIMANQAEFDAQVQALRDAVTAETEQVAAWIAANPNLDTSALSTMVANIEGIFNDPNAGGGETETETTEETTET